MSTSDEVQLRRALDDALGHAWLLEGLQGVREAAEREPLCERLRSAERWRDVQSHRLRAQLDKLSRSRTQVARLEKELRDKPIQPGAITMLRVWWRVLLLGAWFATLTNDGAFPFLRTMTPAMAMWLAIAWGYWRAR